MKCFLPTRHRTEKSGSKQPELRRIRPGQSTTTRHQDSSRVGPRQAGHVPPTASQSSHAASRIEHRPHRSSFNHHRPPGIALCRPSPGSQTAATGLTPPTTDRDRSSEASCRTSIEPLHSQPLSSPRRILLSPSLSSPVRSFLGSPPTAGGLFRLTQPSGTDVERRPRGSSERHKWLCCRQEQKRQTCASRTSASTMKCQCGSATTKPQTSDGTIQHLELVREQ